LAIGKRLAVLFVFASASIIAIAALLFTGLNYYLQPIHFPPPSLLPDPVLFTVNGYNERSTFPYVVVERGQTKQQIVDLFVKPNIAGTNTTLSIDNEPSTGCKSYPSNLKCLPTGIHVSLSNKTVSSAPVHVYLSVSADKTVPSANYPIIMSSSTIVVDKNERTFTNETKSLTVWIKVL
jgi:hypothetical protein